MKYIFFVLSFCLSTFFTNGQSYNYVKGTLDITIEAFNPCGSPAPNNAHLQITTNAADGGSATLIFLDGPLLNDIVSPVVINVGSTFSFNASNTLPDGVYNFIIRDQLGNETINTFAEPVPYPAIVLTDITPVTINQDILTDNTVCTNPTNGQLQASLSGGSLVLPGGGSFDYEWSSTNGLTGLPLNGTTDGTIPLDLAALLGVPGIPGGTYTLKVTDNFSACGEVSRSFTLADPSPTIQTVTTPSPLDICTGDAITITMNGSESGVTYTILRSGVATSNTFFGTGGPLVMTFPSAGFTDNDIIQVRATNGFCTPVTMANTVLLNINPLPTISGVVVGSVCAGTSPANLNYTTLTGAPNQYSIDFDLTAQGQGFLDVINAALPATPIPVVVPLTAAPGNYNAILTVRNSTTGCPSAQIPITISVIGLPSPTIAGANDVCINSTGNLYTTQPGQTNYLWTVSAGGTITAGGGPTNNTVTVTWNTVGAQSISVNYTQNTCAATAPTVYPVNVKPLATPTIVSGPNDICLNSTGNVYTTQAGKTNYVWTVSGGTITAGGTATDNTATVTWNTVGARSISINYSESGCPAATAVSYPVNVKALPTPTVLSGPNDVCVNSTGNIYTTQAGKSNYVWTVTGGTITAGGTAADNTVTVTWNTSGAQSISINYTENGCTAVTPAAYAVNVKALPTPTVATGPNDVCINSTGNVYTTQAGKTNYIWAVSAGGTITAGGGLANNTVTVTWTTIGAKTVSVNYTENGCVAAAPSNYAVNVKPLATPTIVSGPNDVCVNSTGNLYTTQAGKTNYVWTVAGGTITAGGTATDNTATVTWNTVGARSISINYSESGCPAATATSYPVNVKSLPTPTVASGPNDVCINTTGNVYTTQAGKTNYVWTVSAGGTITAGGTATDNSVTVTWNTSGAQSVNINYTENGCTAATPAAYAVNVKALPAPTIVSGPNDVCVNSTGNVYATQAGKTNYVWTVSAGGTITAGGGLGNNTVTVTWATTGAKTVSVNYTENGCVAAAPFNYAVNVKPLATPTIVSGPNDVCVNSTANVYTTQAGKTNYVWTAVGGTITAGGTATDNTVTVTWTTAGARTVTVNYSENGCPAATPVSYPVNVKALPTPTVASGPNDVCINTTGNVYTTQGGKTNYVWTVSAGGTITAGGTATDNTVTVTWNTSGAQSVSINYTENGCTAVTPAAYSVNVKALPTPTVATGPNDVCVNSTGNVYTTQAGKTNYVWTVSAGGTITAGGGLANNTVTVTWTTTGAKTVSVNYAENGCVAAAPFIYAVNVKPLATPTIVSGPNDVCVNSTGNIYTTQAGKTNYVWTVAGGTITAGGTATDNTATVTWNTVGARSVSINYSESGCPAATPVSYPVNVKALPTPTVASGPNDVCVNTTGNVYTTQAGKTNYVWAVSAGGTITAGGTATDNTVTVTWNTSGAQTVSINYTENGCTAAASVAYAVNVKALPTPTIATGPNDVCVNSTGNVYTTQAGKTNYVWTVSAGGTITAGGGVNDNSVTVTWTATGAQSVGINYTENGCSPGAPGTLAVNVDLTPSISGAAVAPVCEGAASTNLTYTAVTGSPNQYNINFDGAAETAGFTDVTAPFAASPISLSITGVSAGTYNATLTVSNTTTGCSSAAVPISVQISVAPTISGIIVGSACAGEAFAALNYSGLTGTPDQFSVAFDDASFTDVVNSALTATPLNIPILTTAAPGTYTATLTIRNSTTGCSSAGVPISISIIGLPVPTITSGPSQACINSTGNVYTTEAGKTDYIWTVSGGGTITAGGGINDNSVTVTWNTMGAQSVSVNYTQNTCTTTTPATLAVNVNDNPTISSINIDPLCAGLTTVDFTYSAVTGTPDQYNIDFDVIAQNAGLADIVGVTFTSSPVSITIPGTVAAGSYNGVLTVVNSSSGCTSSGVPITITILPAPTATITGPAAVCAGSPVTLTVNFTGTGPWTFEYSNGTTQPPITTSLSTISITPLFPALTTTYSVVSISDVNCSNGTGNSHQVVVNQPPSTNLPVTVTPNPLCSGGMADVTVGNSQNGVMYQLRRNNATNDLVGSPVAGTGAAIVLTTDALASSQTFNVLATAAGCPAVQLTALANVNVTGTINAGLTVTATPSAVCAGSPVTIEIANSENGVLYQLRNDLNDANIGSAAPGTGGSITINIPSVSTTTTYNVFANNGTCSIELTDKETVTVSVSPDPSLTVSVLPGTICEGGSAIITVAASQVGVNYQLRSEPGDIVVGSVVAGTGNPISLPTAALTATTTFNILATSTGCPAIMLTTHPTVNVSGVVDASFLVTASANVICAGSPVDILVSDSEVGVDYQLRDGNTAIGTPIAGTGSGISFSLPNLAQTTTFNVLASNGTCSIQLTDTELVNVDIAPNASLAVGTTLNPLCIGGDTQVTVDLSQIGVTYQLFDDSNDLAVGGTQPGNGAMLSFQTGALAATKTFYILATSGGCPAVELTQQAIVTVSGSLNAALTVTSSAAAICAGTGTFITVELSEAGVNYQLWNRTANVSVGAVQAGNGATLNFPTGNLASTPATINYAVVANNGACSIELTDKETITINPSPDVTLAVAPASGLICPGTSTTINITGSEANVTYELRNSAGNVVIGSVLSAGGNISIPTGNLTGNTNFNVFATVGSCSAQLTATASVAVRPIGDPACGPSGSDCANFATIIPTIVTQPSCNDRDAGEVSFSISRSNGTPTTFRVIWSYNGTNQTKFTSNTVSFDDLSSGNYQYTIIDEGNGKTCGPVDFFLDLKTQVVIEDKNVIASVTCFEGTDGNVELKVDGTTTGEYWYKYVVDGQESIAQTFTPGAPLPGGLPADDDDFIIIKVDQSPAFSCPDTVMVRIKHAYPKIDFAVASTEVTTCNGTDGAIQVTAITGGNTTATALQIRLKKEVALGTDPSGYITVADFETVIAGAKEYTDLAQGNYIVDIKDGSDCIQSEPIAIQAPGQVPLAVIDMVATDASCANEGASGTIQVTINQPGIYQVAVSPDQVNVPADDQFVSYNSPSLPNITFNNLVRGRYFLYIKSSTTECPTRTDVISIGGVYAVSDFDIISNCENVNLTLNNIAGQEDTPFIIRVFKNEDKFFKIDSLTASAIPLSNSVSFNYAAPLTHKFLTEEGTYRFVMIQKQTTGAGTCTLVSDTVVYEIRQQVGIVLGQIKPSFPEPKHTGSIEVENILGGTRFVSGTNELYYEISLSTADDDIVIVDWTQLKLSPQNKFSKLFDYISPGVYRIKVRDASGCIKTQDVEITLDPSVYVPNIFTPNEDAVNDQFEILNLPMQGKHKMIVSNRWGNQVFSSDDYREGNFWNGDGASDGIYFYRLKVEGGETYTGWVEILRGNKP